MKLSTWAKQNDVSYQTALRWIKNGTFPDKYERLATGTIRVIDESKLVPSTDNGVHIYARVSSNDQRADLTRQVSRLRDYAASQGWPILSETQEIASGMNDHRRKLQKLLSNKEAKIILVEHRDRLARFGVDTLTAALEASNRKVIVMNETESSFDLVQDFIDVVTSMCARIYGQRSSKNRAQRAIASAENYSESQP